MCVLLGKRPGTNITDDVKMFCSAATQSSLGWENKIATKWGRIQLVRKFVCNSFPKVLSQRNEKRQMPFHCQCCNVILSLMQTY